MSVFSNYHRSAFGIFLKETFHKDGIVSGRLILMLWSYLIVQCRYMVRCAGIIIYYIETDNDINDFFVNPQHVHFMPLFLFIHFHTRNKKLTKWVWLNTEK